MKDYKEISGLDIKLEDIGLVYDQNVFGIEPKTRTYEEAKDVYLEKGAEEKDLYYMYRYMEKSSDSDIFEENKVEYDVTVINAGTIGPELIKTAGHYHGYVPDTEITYPEIYEVIDGSIDYLLQTKPDTEGNVDVVIVQAKAGDKVIVPPNYGHISVNVGTETAVSSNLQFRDLPATADYESFKVNNGGALYRIDSGWENNLNYKIKTLRKVMPKDKPDWGIIKGKPLYSSFIESPEKFRYLSSPQEFDFSDIWEPIAQ
jgi:glucose-6-phosphate isomerase